MTTTQPQPLPPQELQISDYIGVILRRRMTVALVFLTVFITVALYTFLATPIYEAAATLHVKDDKAKGGMLGELSLGSTNPINAEIEIFKSRTNAEKVVKELHLDWQVTKKSEGVTFQLLNFASTAKIPSYLIELGDAGAYSVKYEDDGRLVGQGKSGLLMQGKEVTLLLSDLRGRKGDSFVLTLLPFAGAVAALQGGITVKEQGRMTSILRASYTHKDPVLARDVVNSLVQAYLGQNVALKAEEASRTVTFVGDQISGLRDELDISEKNLQAYKSSTGVVKLDAEATELIHKVSEIEKDRTEVTLQKKQIEFALDALKEAMRKGDIYTPTVLRGDPLIAGMAAKLSELEVQKRALRTDYTEAYPAVKALQGQIDEVQKKIRSTYETGLTNLTKQQGALSQQLALYEGTMRNLPEAERDLARLTRLSSVAANTYTFLLQKHGEARIAKASTISSINIVDPAIVPGVPIKPKKRQNLLLGLIVGLALGIGLAFFQDYLDDTIKDGDEAKRVMGLPLLAVIPHIPQDETDEAGAAAPETGKLFTQMSPKSVAAEAFRSLRTNLHFSAIQREKKIMLVTSSFPSEGKSIISANLANILSQTGARVLIIDCDLRRSSLHTKFGHSKTPGLSELLAGDITFTAAIHDIGIPGLDLITAGTTPPNPSELLGSEAMRQFLLDQRAAYDNIVIDAPPLLAVTDAPVLTEISDLVVLVMEVGRVPIAAARHMREMLATIKAPVAGLVINDKTGKGEAYGYGRYGGKYYRYGKSKGYGYGYGYSSGYGYYSDEDKPHKPKKKSPWWKKIVGKGWEKFVSKRWKSLVDKK